MDVDRHVVTVRGEQVSMPLKEFDLLEILVRNSGETHCAQLIDRVWGWTTSGTPRRWTFTSNAYGPKWKPILRPRPLGHRPWAWLQVRRVRLARSYIAGGTGSIPS